MLRFFSSSMNRSRVDRQAIHVHERGVQVPGVADRVGDPLREDQAGGAGELLVVPRGQARSARAMKPSSRGSWWRPRAAWMSIMLYLKPGTATS